MFDLSGNLATVVGGLGQIGINSVEALLEFNSEVIILDKTNISESEQALNLQKKYRNRLHFIQMDITDESSIMDSFQEIQNHHSNIDVLVNHAHFKGDPKKLVPHSDFFASVENYPFEIWKETIDVNLNGLFLVTKEAGKIMINNRKGNIINTASTYGLVSPNKNIYGTSGINSPVSYAVTKAAIINFTKYIATHWAEHNIRANCLSPGGVGNPNQSKEFVQNYNKLTPLQRMALPTDYQGAVVFLASEASSYMTGSNLIIDGGWTAW